LTASTTRVETPVNTALDRQPAPQPAAVPSAVGLVRRVRAEPGRAAAAARAIAVGYLCRVVNRLLGRRLRAGRNLRVFGWLSLRGPGEVILGDDVVIHGRATLWTYAPDARIVIGDRVNMSGTAFGCVREIRVGRLSIVARAQIRDTDFHSLAANRRSPEAPVRVAPVHIGDNVWISDRVGILPGTRIGDNSVVSFGALCGREYPANVVIVGNPAKVAAPIPGSSSPLEG
jgi:acetyltransferase-like isoleucine patch superfamily enzyme